MIPITTLAGLLAAAGLSAPRDPLRSWIPGVVATPGQTLTLNMTTGDSSSYTVDWGDGTTSTVASNANATKTYAGGYSGNINVSSTGIFTKINAVSGTAALSSTVAQLPTGLTSVYINNSLIALTGTIAQLPTGLTYLYLIGNSIAVTGTVAQLPSALGTLGLNGSSFAVTGTTAQLPTVLLSLVLVGSSIAITGSATPWRTASMRYIFVSNGLTTSAHVDDLLIALANVTSWTNEKIVDLRGASAARTAASNAAKATIEGYGVTVLTN